MSSWFLFVFTLAASPEYIQMPNQSACVLQMSAQFYRETLATNPLRQYSMCYNAITSEKIYPDDVSYELMAIRRAAR